MKTQSPMPPALRMRRTLREACNASPAFRLGGGARLGFTMERQGNVWSIDIFDRSPAWIMPRYGKSFRNRSRKAVYETALAWINARLPDLCAVAEPVRSAVVTARPFNSGALA